MIETKGKFTMKKIDIIERLAQSQEITKKSATEVVNDVFDIITDGIANDKFVDIYGFGKFEIQHRDARTGRNPQDGSEIQIPAKNSVKFKAASALKNTVNE